MTLKPPSECAPLHLPKWCHKGAKGARQPNGATMITITMVMSMPDKALQKILEMIGV